MMNLKSSLCKVRSLVEQCRESIVSKFCDTFVDWVDNETALSHLGGAAPGAAKSGGDRLWDDNWDDDDVEEAFSVQLRYANFHFNVSHIRTWLNACLSTFGLVFVLMYRF